MRSVSRQRPKAARSTPRERLLRLTRFTLIATFALWVPLGPCVMVASAWMDVKPCCQKKLARKVGCHGNAASDAKAAAKPDCKCHRQVELTSGRCPCGHDAAMLILNVDPARLAAVTTITPVMVVTRIDLPLPAHVSANAPPDSPPPISAHNS
ncbi:MAG: hypothetical protein E4H03_12970 [Myxococcales bacterium]|nr:MAG: hypothetical protein E4H03_12970 [Myxococcales bacterium]